MFLSFTSGYFSGFLYGGIKLKGDSMICEVVECKFNNEKLCQKALNSQPIGINKFGQCSKIELNKKQDVSFERAKLFLKKQPKLPLDVLILTVLIIKIYPTMAYGMLGKLLNISYYNAMHVGTTLNNDPILLYSFLCD